MIILSEFLSPCLVQKSFFFFFWTQHWRAYLYTLDEAFSKCIMNYDFMLNVFIILEHNKK